MGLSATDVPPPGALAALQTPEGQAHYAEFKAKWPKFAAQMETGGQVPKGVINAAASGSTSSSPNPFNATSTGTPGVPPINGAAPDPGKGTVNPALANGNIPPSADDGIAATQAALSQRGTAKPAAAPAPAPAPTMPPTAFQNSIQNPYGPKVGVLDGTGNGLGLITQQIPQR